MAMQLTPMRNFEAFRTELEMNKFLFVFWWSIKNKLPSRAQCCNLFVLVYIWLFTVVKGKSWNTNDSNYTHAFGMLCKLCHVMQLRRDIIWTLITNSWKKIKFFISWKHTICGNRTKPHESPDTRIYFRFNIFRDWLTSCLTNYHACDAAAPNAGW